MWFCQKWNKSNLWSSLHEKRVYQNAPFANAPFAKGSFPNGDYSCLWTLCPLPSSITAGDVFQVWHLSSKMNSVLRHIHRPKRGVKHHNWNFFASFMHVQLNFSGGRIFKSPSIKIEEQENQLLHRHVYFELELVKYWQNWYFPQ